MLATISPMTLSPGDPAPDFALTDDSGTTVSLADYAGRTVLLFAYPAAMTPGCTKEACDFRDSLGAFDRAGYAILGISPDKPEKLARFREQDGSDVSPAVRSRQGRAHRLRGLRREEAVRQGRHGRHPLDLRDLPDRRRSSMPSAT